MMSLDAEFVPKQDSSWLRWASLLAVGVAAIMWAGIAVLSAAGSASGWKSIARDEDAGKADNLSQSFRTAAKRALPAVVVIKTSNRARTNEDAYIDEPFSRRGFEDSADEEDFDWQHSRSESEPVLGSGVVIDAQGIVLTNNHVVEGADELVVRLADGRQFPAIIERTDSNLDLAVLRVKSATPLPAARLGDSDGLEIGDWVLAIGSPFELDQTVSAGIISAKGRFLDSAGSARLLQTDAAINPGSSGGPLVNLAGEVVGITTAIASRTGGYQGIAFAVPINLAKQLPKQLR
jgi:serine protease Do